MTLAEILMDRVESHARQYESNAVQLRAAAACRTSAWSRIGSRESQRRMIAGAPLLR
jgi:hypothetical protein